MNCELKTKRFVANPIGENCYLVWDDSRECAIIDCGAWGDAKEEKIYQFIVENNLHPVMALQTHMHFDHTMGLPFLYREFGLKPQCHAEEMPVYEAAPAMVREWFDMELPPLVPIGQYLCDGQELNFGRTRVRVIHTPGHTPGGLCFYLPEAKVLFSGDTLFQGSVGRSDLPGGNARSLVEGIRTKLLTLPSDVTVYPGHGPATTIADERQSNPYL